MSSADIYFPEGAIPYPCPLKGCCGRPCSTDWKIALEETVYEDENGGYQKGCCYQLNPPEPFLISEDEIVEEFERQAKERTMMKTFSSDGTEQILNVIDLIRKDVKRDKSEIIGEVRKAAAGADNGCHHRDKAKDKIVQKVICRLAKPGVTFSIHDACEKIGGNGAASWLYSWCHDHEEEIRAQVDILRSADMAFRS